ncbi:unnamed protein product [Rotaria sordida]|uniref:Uncharacterized protein n=1 Tax=Rotaria sordida TaxID=392033 RepID=A0A814CCJ9_9BILA|nr:unnamed protein product [Rotaria sordida]CAF1082734.1 unnamed protein product [Rotaria sordida]
MTKYSNHHCDVISTVQLSPFGEDHWHRIVTYSPMYFNWSDFIMMNRKHTPKKRTLISPIDINAVKLEDQLLLNEIHTIQRATIMPSVTRFSGKNSYESKYFDEEHCQRPTSPTDEYQRSSDFFHQTRESPILHSNYVETSLSHQQYTTKHSLLQPKNTSNAKIKVLSKINFGPKPQASLSVQLRQSAIARENALTTAADHRSTTPLSMSSSKRAAGGSAHSSRRSHQKYRFLYPQTPPPSETYTIGVKSTNTSRSKVHMIKTKTDRARKQQHTELKTILVKPCRQLLTSDNTLEETIPNSIETMRQLRGSIPAFEKNLRYTYHKQLNKFRNDLKKC